MSQEQIGTSKTRKVRKGRQPGSSLDVLQKRGSLRLAFGIVSGLGRVEAAEQAGISKSTAFRRLRDPKFKRYLAELRAEIGMHGLDVLRSKLVEACEELGALIHHEDANLRMQASDKVIRRFAELSSAYVEDRLAELEERIERIGEANAQARNDRR